MKKLLTFTLLLVAGAASAASIDWNYSFGTRTIKDSDGQKLTGTAYLILADDLGAIQAAADPNDASKFLDALTDEQTGKALDSIGISNGKTTSNSGTATDSDLNAGTQYTLQVIVYDTAKNQYYVSATQTGTAYDPASSVPELQDGSPVTFSGAELGATTGTKPNENEWSSATPQQPAVPEPATGALALAGVALLFKRRRA